MRSLGGHTAGDTSQTPNTRPRGRQEGSAHIIPIAWKQQRNMQVTTATISTKINNNTTPNTNKDNNNIMQRVNAEGECRGWMSRGSRRGCMSRGACVCRIRAVLSWRVQAKYNIKRVLPRITQERLPRKRTATRALKGNGARRAWRYPCVSGSRTWASRSTRRPSRPTASARTSCRS